MLFFLLRLFPAVRITFPGFSRADEMNSAATLIPHQQDQHAPEQIPVYR
jgi:hypothetical protein